MCEGFNKAKWFRRCRKGLDSERVGAVRFFRHSPLPGANDEKSSIIWQLNPGLRLLRSLALGYHISRLRRLRMVKKSFLQSEMISTL